MTGVNEHELVRRLMQDKERLRTAVYAVAGHPDTPERVQVRVIATSVLKELGYPLPPRDGLSGGCWEGEAEDA